MGDINTSNSGLILALYLVVLFLFCLAYNIILNQSIERCSKYCGHLWLGAIAIIAPLGYWFLTFSTTPMHLWIDNLSDKLIIGEIGVWLFVCLMHIAIAVSLDALQHHRITYRANFFYPIVALLGFIWTDLYFSGFRTHIQMPAIMQFLLLSKVFYVGIFLLISLYLLLCVKLVFIYLRKKQNI
jgi:hypothetical protein